MVVRLIKLARCWLPCLQRSDSQRMWLRQSYVRLGDSRLSGSLYLKAQTRMACYSSMGYTTSLVALCSRLTCLDNLNCVISEVSTRHIVKQATSCCLCLQIGSPVLGDGRVGGLIGQPLRMTWNHGLLEFGLITYGPSPDRKSLIKC